MPFTIADLLAAEPRLAALSAAARACPPGDWITFHRSVGLPLRNLVGWFAPRDVQPDERLRTSEAFTVALRALVTAWELSTGGQVVDA